ncbi:MAG: ABC transporter permease [Anaerolineae bacterium]|nr:ABC transporter permease [Anaerolineae bacterium]
MTDKPKTYIWQALLEKSFNILIPVFAILAAFLISGILIIAWGANPLEAYKALLAGAFGTPNAIATTMTRLSPLVFTGLAVSYGYRSGFFNIGAEGQFFLGALAATWVGITFTNLPGWVLIPLCALAAALAGAFLAVIPGLLKALRGFNEVLTTLLLNYVAIQYFEWALRIEHYRPDINVTWDDKPIKWTFLNWIGVKDVTQPFPQSPGIVEAAELPKLGTLLKTGLLNQLFGQAHWYEEFVANPAVNRMTLAPIIALVFVVIMYFVLFRMTVGFQARAVGVNPDAARFMGINVPRTIIITSLISGALAGLGGSIEVLGAQHRVIPNFLVNAGFDGIPVALIGQLHPAGVFLSALFFGALRAGANKMQILTQVPISVVYVIQALAILFAIAGALLDLQSKIKIARLAKQTEAAGEQPVAEKEVSGA